MILPADHPLAPRITVLRLAGYTLEPARGPGPWWRRWTVWQHARDADGWVRARPIASAPWRWWLAWGYAGPLSLGPPVYEEPAGLSAPALPGWFGEVCKRCLRRNCIGFNVADEVWQAVTGGRFGILCTTCFDQLAEAAGVAYAFGKVCPVSWSDWMEP